MYGMRYPRVFSEAEIKIRMSQLPSTIAIAGLPQAPSLPGLAFAACAATLPLLLRRDVTTASRVASLLLSTLPFMLEPKAADVDPELFLSEINCGRVQHLLNRMEQVRFSFNIVDVQPVHCQCNISL
jgi:hypothetical protein